MHDLITIHPQIVSGTPVFKGTRVPIKSLFDYLVTGQSLETYLEDFPSVNKEQALKVLDLSGDVLLKLCDSLSYESIIG
ncbi:MAG: DUF433 domain-containing protein [Microscillaceae bacterium]|nr:DUF433 domain-containing protein [Microscillaceae bacterium]